MSEELIPPADMARLRWANIRLIGPRFLSERPDMVDAWFEACEKVLQQRESEKRTKRVLP